MFLHGTIWCCDTPGSSPTTWLPFSRLERDYDLSRNILDLRVPHHPRQSIPNSHTTSKILIQGTQTTEMSIHWNPFTELETYGVETHGVKGSQISLSLVSQIGHPNDSYSVFIMFVSRILSDRVSCKSPSQLTRTISYSISYWWTVSISREYIYGQSDWCIFIYLIRIKIKIFRN